MALEDGRACTSEHVVDTSASISTGGGELVSCLVKAGVENFVVVTTEFFDALASANVPKPRCPIDTAGQAIITSKVELAAGELGGVA